MDGFNVLEGQLAHGKGQRAYHKPRLRPWVSYTVKTISNPLCGSEAEDVRIHRGLSLAHHHQGRPRPSARRLHRPSYFCSGSKRWPSESSDPEHVGSYRRSWGPTYSTQQKIGERNESVSLNADGTTKHPRTPQETKYMT